MAFRADTFVERVEKAVSAVETRCRAEVVVVVAPRSGSYADVNLRWAILFGLLALAIILHSPFHFHPDLVLLDVALLGALGGLLSHRLDPMRRLLTTRRRRHAQVEAAARQAFVEEKVSATRERTGVLLYVSLMEREVAILPDHGIDGMVPRAEWNEVIHRMAGARDLKDLEDRFFAALDRLKERLPLHLPAAEENPDEIPNRPRMRA